MSDRMGQVDHPVEDAHARFVALAPVAEGPDVSQQSAVTVRIGRFVGVLDLANMSPGDAPMAARRPARPMPPSKRLRGEVSATDPG
jgi:hypothetical protein